MKKDFDLSVRCPYNSNHSTPLMPKATPAPEPVAPAKGRKHQRTRLIIELTMRPDLRKFAKKYFKTTKWGSLSRFVDSKVLQHARIKKKAIMALKIPLPNLELRA